MTKEEFKKFCKKYDFDYYADFKLDGEHFGFENFQDNCPEKGYVYLWVEEYKSRVRIIYVGKAEKQTMRSRCYQHSKGDSKIGRTHTAELLAGLKHKSYFVYARKSQISGDIVHKVDKIVDEDGISMCHVEEQAFIKKLKERQGPKSLWNKG